MRRFTFGTGALVRGRRVLWVRSRRGRGARGDSRHERGHPWLLPEERRQPSGDRPEPGDDCRPSEIAISWSQTGPQGRRGHWHTGAEGRHRRHRRDWPNGRPRPPRPEGRHRSDRRDRPAGATGATGPEGRRRRDRRHRPRREPDHGPQVRPARRARPGRPRDPDLSSRRFRHGLRRRREHRRSNVTPPPTCSATTLTTSMTSFTNGDFVPVEEWPGGKVTLGTPTCNVTIQRPAGRSTSPA